LIAVVIGVCCWPGAGQAQDLSTIKQTNEFLNWCRQNGFTSQDSKGVTCHSRLGHLGGVIVMVGSGVVDGCTKLYDTTRAEMRRTGRDVVDVSAALFARPIYQWLTNNVGNLSNDLDNDIDAALWALYRCKCPIC
jgi:hypothetical protein